MERELGKLAEVVESCPVDEAQDVISLLPSTGGGPAYNITKVQIEQLKETGLIGVELQDFWESRSELFKDEE